MFRMFTEVLEEEVDGHDGDRTDDCFGEHASTAEAADSGSTPDRGSRGETFDRVTVFKDDTCAQEADTGNDLRDDTTVITTDDIRRHKHIQRTANGDERDGTRADHLTVELTLHSNEIT